MEHSVADLIQNIRRRPGMYVGSMGNFGLHRLPLSLLHAGFIAAREGRGREQWLHLEADGACTFTFDGPLWPMQLASGPAADAFERVLTQDPVNPRAPRPKRGPVFLLDSMETDLLLVNALSSELECEVWTEAGAWRQRFRCGRPVEPLSAEPRGARPRTSPVGTRIRFVPDASLFEWTRFSSAGLASRLEQLAGLQAGLTCRLRDDVRGQEARSHFERGLPDWCARLAEPHRPLHAPWSFEGQHKKTHVRLALQWAQGAGAGVLSWVNTLRAHAGTHLEGFTQGLHHALHDFAQATGRASEFDAYSHFVLKEGLTVLLDVTVPEPLWYGPIKGHLANKRVEPDVEQLVQGWLGAAFAQHPATAEQILEFVIARSVARG